MLLFDGIAVVTEQPAETGFKHIALSDGIGQWGTGTGRSQRYHSADAVDHSWITSIPGGIGQDPAHYVAAIGVGDKDQLIQIAGVDKALQLIDQTAGSGLIPHILLEVTVDDLIVTRGADTLTN